MTPFPNSGFEHDLWVAVDAPLHSVYVVYQKDDALIVIDTNVCNGSHLAACATLTPPTIHTGTDPESVVLDQQTQTLYTANEVDNDVSVIDASRCNAQTTSGCRHPAPAFTSQPGALAADAAVHTLYDTSGASSVVDDQHERLQHRLAGGCAQTPPTVTVGDFPDAVAVDHRTHTVYVANHGSGATGTVSVIDARTCNATDSAGCANLQTLQVPAGNPDDIAVNAATDTIYVATITSSGPDLVSVFNGATCNATNTGGCDQTPATVAVGRLGRRARQLQSQPRRQPGDQHDLRDERLQHRRPPAIPGQQRLRDQRRHLRRGEHDRLRPDPSHRHARLQPPGRIQPLGNRGRPSHEHHLHREHRRRRAPRHRLGDQRRDLQRPEHQRLRPDPSHRPSRLRRKRHRHRPHEPTEVYVTNIEDTSVSVIDGAHLQRLRHHRLQPDPDRKSPSATTQARSPSTPPSAAPTSPTAITPSRSYRSPTSPARASR